MAQKTLVLTNQTARRDPQGNLIENHVNYTITVKGDEDRLKKAIDKVLKTGRAEYLETDQKSVLVMTKALLESSVVYFVEDK